MKKQVSKTQRKRCASHSRAKELDCPIVISSIMGTSALMLLDLAEELGFTGPVVIVRGVSNKYKNGVNLMDAETKKQIEARGATVVTAGHALSVGERDRRRGVWAEMLDSRIILPFWSLAFGHGLKCRSRS